MIASDKKLPISDLVVKYEIPIAEDLSHKPLIKNKLRLIPYLFAKEKTLIPFQEETEVIFVAMANPFDMETIEEMSLLLQKKIDVFYGSREEIEQAIQTCYHQDHAETSEVFSNHKVELQDEHGEIEDGYDLMQSKTESPIIRMLNVILIEAIQQGASDIHFEPGEGGLRIRYRIDGVLQYRHSPPKEYQKQLVTRIKVLAKLDIAQQRLPQDGRIKLLMGNRQIDFRVSTVPVVFGERLVLRILDRSQVVLGLGQIGMEENILMAFRRYIRQSQGIILVTGPTGSGKTTTLYSALSEINSKDINIMTVEDPVEYKFPEIAQIGVNPKIDLYFATGLRHILRQDPDVIMIGEIRDRETAEIAIQSALTGHLVLSTLHTNDAPSSITRLVDMGIEPYLLSSSVIAVLAQRLVRKLCPICKEGYHPLPQELNDIGASDSLLEAIFYKPVGCNECFQSGYKGRMGIYELMDVDYRIKRQLLKSADASDLRNIAKEEGMKSLREYGIELVKQGATSTAELLRVSR